MERTTSAKNTLDKVASEFSKELQAELEDGKKAALDKLLKVQKETDDALAKIMETGAKQAVSLRRQTVGSAELDSRNMQLRVLEDSVNEVFAEALTRLSKVSPSAREKSLSSLIRDGVNVIGGRAKIACSEEDKKVVSAIIKKMNKGSIRLALDSKSIDTLGGVVLTTADGTVKFDNTFEARLERSRPLLRKQVAEHLTGGKR